MSSTNKWILAIVIIAVVVLGLWWGGYLGGTTPTVDQDTQSAATLNAAAKIDSSDAIIASEAAAIEAQMQVAGNQFAAFSQKPTAAGADLLAGQFANVSKLMTAIAVRFQPRIANLKNMGADVNAIQTALSDMSLQISMAVSEIGLSGQAIAKIKPDNGNKTQINQNSASLQQSVIELQKASAYLQSAQNDIKTIIAGFKTTTVR